MFLVLLDNIFAKASCFQAGLKLTVKFCPIKMNENQINLNKALTYTSLSMAKITRILGVVRAAIPVSD